MKVYVQGENSLIPLQSEVTADSVEEALGYTPVNEEDLPDITNEDDSTLYVADKDGNIITKTDSDGFHAGAMTVNGKDVESGLVTDEDRASWGGSDLDDVISKDDDSTLYVVDGSGNVIAKIDENGLHTTEIELGGEGETKVNVKEHIENGDIHPTVHEWAKAEIKPTYTANEVGLGNVDNTADVDKPISTAQQAALDALSEQIVSPNGEWTVTDKDGNIIATIDKDGLHTTEVYINGESATEKLSLLAQSLSTVESIAKGATQAVSYGNYSTMVTALNALSKDTYNIGQNIYIVTKEVPDLWVSAISDTYSEYTYVNDSTLTAYLSVYGKVQVGYYVLSQLETQKVDLPTALADLADDETHRTVTDTEKATWNAKMDANGWDTSESSISKSNGTNVVEYGITSIGWSNDTEQKNGALTFPQKTGTFATTDDIPTVPDWAKAETKPTYTAEEVGLGNVDNTADVDKPVSTAQQAALDALAEQIVSPNGEWTVTDKDGNIIATIDADGLHTTTVEAESIVLDGEEFTPDTFATKYTEGLAYTLSDDGTYYSVSGIGTATDVDIVIPSEYEGLPVTAIKATAFFNNKTIKSVKLPDSITLLGGQDFFGCSALEKINIPKSITTIGYWSLQSCSSLTMVYIPSTVTTIGECAFDSSNLTIFCEAAERPEGWHYNWRGGSKAVYWGVSNPPNVGEAAHALTADTADEATHATSADSATKATQDSNGDVIADTYATMQDLEDGAIPVASAETANSLKSGWAVSHTTSSTGYGAPTMTVGKAYLIAFIVSSVTHTAAFVYMGNSGYSTPNKDGVFCYYNASTNKFQLEDGNGTITASAFYVREL